MDTIRTYPIDSEEYGKLATACQLLTARHPNGTVYRVENVYFDFGLRWMWTTICAYSRNGHSWQALCPRDHERIIFSNDMEKTVSDIVNDKYWCDPS